MKDVFLCHTGANKPWVEELAMRLESESIGDRRISVFLDKWDIDQGQNVLSRIEEALATCRFVAVVMSPAFGRAEWPRLEWQTRVWQDPTGKAASILPILLERFDPETGEPIEIPLPLRMIKWFDFSEPKRYEREFADLVRRLRGEPPQRGGGAVGTSTQIGRGNGPRTLVPADAADRCDERLMSNLMRVHRHPAHVWSTLTTASPRDVLAALRGRFRPPFILDSGRLYCFFPPNDPTNPFRSILSGQDPREERPVDWLEDPVRSRWLMWMYNDALREHCYRLAIRTPKIPGQKQTSRERHQYYCPVLDGRPREFQWDSTRRVRTLSKVGAARDGARLGVHYAARMRFIALANDAYLMVEPGWLFTEDGITPLQGRLVGVLSTKWGGKERNAAVLKNVLMWGLLLSEGRPRFEIVLGAETLLLDAVPAHARLGVGVDGDQIRLDRLVAGEGAGEVPRAPNDSPYADEDDPGVKELNEFIELERRGILDSMFTEEVEGDAHESDAVTIAITSEDQTAQDGYQGSDRDAPPPRIAGGSAVTTTLDPPFGESERPTRSRGRARKSGRPRDASSRSTHEDGGGFNDELELPL